MEKKDKNIYIPNVNIGQGYVKIMGLQVFYLFNL